MYYINVHFELYYINVKTSEINKIQHLRKRISLKSSLTLELEDLDLLVMSEGDVDVDITIYSPYGWGHHLQFQLMQYDTNNYSLSTYLEFGE